MSKKVSVNSSSCPSCGATMKYSPEKQKLLCENCLTCKDIEFNAVKDKKLWRDRLLNNKQKSDWVSENKSLKCPNCGANIILSSLEFSSSCPYCDTSVVGQNAEIETISPDGIIPFKLSHKEASEKYVNGVKKKFFVPRAFKKAPPVENIKGIYIPSFSFDAKTTSTYKGTLADDDSYTDSRGNRKTRTTYKNISGTHSAENIDVVVESSSKLNQVQMSEILPYNMKNIVEFKQGFIMGYTVEQYENAIEDCYKIGKRIMEENIKRAILSGYSYDRVCSFDMTTSYMDEKYMYYLLPVYKCAFKYKNKNYTTFMNGETGKVGGGFPISPIKVTFAVLLVILIVFGIMAAVMLLQ